LGRGKLAGVCLTNNFFITARHFFVLLSAMLILCQSGAELIAQSATDFGYGKYWTVSGNFDVDYQRTQFYAPNQNAAVGDCWSPPKL
jgi:hypothetical protein